MNTGLPTDSGEERVFGVLPLSTSLPAGRTAASVPVERLSPTMSEAELLVIAAIRDVTERKRLEATRRQSRELSTPCCRFASSLFSSQ